MTPFNDEVDKVLEQYGLDEPGYAMVASDLADLMDEKTTEIKRLQNELMCLKEDNDTLVAKVESQKDLLISFSELLHIREEQLEDELKINVCLQSDLNGKNFLLDKALIDTAILVQEITYLKEQSTLLKGIK